MGSRLFDEIREQRGLAYSVYSVDHAFADVPILQLSAGLESGKCVEAYTRMREIVNELRTDGPSEDEFERARAYAAGRRVLAFENTNAVARHAATQSVVFGQDIDPDEAIAALDRTTFEQVSEVARGISDAASVACVGPHEVERVHGLDRNRRAAIQSVSLWDGGETMRLLLVAVLATLVAASPAAAQDKKKRKKPPKPVEIQLLSINDFHGHLDGDNNGTVTRTGLPEDRVPAGGAAYLATHLRMLRHRNPRTVFVAAGDLVGGSPLLSSLFHDEPTIEVMNRMNLFVSAVGNHEFDEGQAELRRMQRGGCHPTEGCRDGDGFTGAKFRYLAANVTNKRTGKRFFPGYAVRRFGGVKVGFIGMTLKGTSQFVAPSSSAGIRFRDEALTANKYARYLKRRGVRAIVVLLHEGGFAVKKDVGANGCPGLSGPLESIVRHTTHDVDLFLTGHTHQFYNCVIDGRPVTSAGSYGRVITKVDMDISRRTGEAVAVRARNWVVGQDVIQAPDIASADRALHPRSRRRSATASSGVSRGAPAARATPPERARWATWWPTRTAPPPAPPRRS